MQDCENVVIDGEKRVRLHPQMWHEYWLGYLNSGDLFDRRSVRGIYFGASNGVHLFLNKTNDVKIERYICRGACLLNYYSDGDDEPEVPAVCVLYDGLMPEGNEKSFAFDRIDKSKAQPITKS